MKSIQARALQILTALAMAQGLSMVAPAQKHDMVLLARRIQACGNDVECAVSLLQQKNGVETNQIQPPEHYEEEPLVAAMEVCGKAQRHDVALQIYNDMARKSSERCRTRAISICAKCNHVKLGLDLLLDENGTSPPQAGSWNAAIAACGSLYWKESLSLLKTEMPSHMISTLTCNAVMANLVKAKQGVPSLALLHEMMQQNNENTDASPRFPRPDRVTFHRTLSALIRSDMVDKAYKLLVDTMEPGIVVKPNNETYDMVSNAYRKRGNRTMAITVDSRRYNNTSKMNHEQERYNFQQQWDDYGPGMIKVGRGKAAYWNVGYYTHDSVNLTIGFQTNRNPSKNGIKMLFFDNNDNKIGFLLMMNSLSDSESKSSLLGMYLSPEKRQVGLSSICLAIWIHFCLEANVVPQTGIIQKPILALVLQHKFGFLPVQGGVDVEISRPNNNNNTDSSVVLYSPVAKSLYGAFSPWDLKQQNIVLTNAPSTPRGQKIRVGCKFQVPSQRELIQRIENVLKGKCGNGNLQYKTSPRELRRILLGI